MEPFIEGIEPGRHGVSFGSIPELGVLVTGLTVMKNEVAADPGTETWIPEQIDVVSQIAERVVEVSIGALAAGVTLNNDEPITVAFTNSRQVLLSESAVRVVAGGTPGANDNPKLQDPIKHRTAVGMYREHAAAANKLGLEIRGYNVPEAQ